MGYEPKQEMGYEAKQVMGYEPIRHNSSQNTAQIVKVPM
jgi:hypothetical protein